MDDMVLEEMRREHLVEEAVRQADAVILPAGRSEDEMLELTYLVGMKMLEKVGFQLYLKREKLRIQESLGLEGKL